MYVVLVGLGLAPVLIAGQMVRLSWIEGEALREKSRQQASSLVEIPAMRGSILDRAGRALVVNTAEYDLALDPKTTGLSERKAELYRKLSRLTGRPARHYRRKVDGRVSPRYVVLEHGLSERQKEAVDEWEIPGLILEPKFARRYNYGSAAGHLLGHVDRDLRGIAGLELQYDRFLAGRNGRRAAKRDMRGRIKAYVGGTVVEPVHGEDLVLTVDLIRQVILEEELAAGVRESRAAWGTAIAMDPYTGAILALANVPSYDPNRPAAYPEAAQRNRAVTDRIEPGSTFKLVTAVAALERSIVRPEDTLDAGPGWATIRGRPMRDSHAHGRISFADVIAQSSNVGVAKTALRLDPGVFYQYARNFGFGQPTLVDLPGEVPGRLKRPSEWSRLTQPWMSIGYEVEATALQVLAAYCALANGGLLVQPHVVSERRDLAGRRLWQVEPDSVRRVFRRETAARLLPLFERVVQEGTAKKAQVPGLRIAGKTGTAQTARGGSYDRGSYRASFAGFFPAERPSVAMIVVLGDPENGSYGGAVSAPVFARIAQRWIATFPEVAARMAPAGELPKPAVRPVPDVTGRPLAAAARRLRALGFEAALPEAAGGEPFRIVVAQQPGGGAAAAPGTPVRVTVAARPPAPERMPDLTGLSVREALALLAARKVPAEVRGSGAVVEQRPAAGAPVSGKAVLTCR